ncbi:hypothetical protein DRP07_00250 [Archaeoglobales archaeon]|nr:MAG: hypothetical protein DRP07_00250 [Archaeoglobales archaeon]
MKARITLITATLLLFILALATASADITVNQNTSISPLAVNTTFFFSTTFTFSYIDIYDDHVDFGGFNFSVIPSTNSVNVTLSKLTSSEIRFTASAPSGETVTFTIGGLQPGKTYTIKRSDGRYWDGQKWGGFSYVAAPPNGEISFTNSQWSSKNFRIELYTPPGQLPTPTPQPSPTPTPAPTIPPIIPPPEQGLTNEQLFAVIVIIVSAIALVIIIKS